MPVDKIILMVRFSKNDEVVKLAGDFNLYFNPYNNSHVFKIFHLPFEIFIFWRTRTQAADIISAVIGPRRVKLDRWILFIYSL